MLLTQQLWSRGCNDLLLECDSLDRLTEGVEMFTRLYVFIKECITSPFPLSSDWGREVLQIPSCSPWLVFWPLACIREPPRFTSLEQGMLLVLSVGLVLRFFFPFWMWIIFKLFVEFVTMLPLLSVLVFWLQTM